MKTHFSAKKSQGRNAFRHRVIKVHNGEMLKECHPLTLTIKEIESLPSIVTSLFVHTDRTNCQHDAIVASDPRTDMHKPECTSDGRYEMVQTMVYSGDRLYWCVDKNFGTKTHKHFFSKLDELPCLKKRAGKENRMNIHFPKVHSL